MVHRAWSRHRFRIGVKFTPLEGYDDPERSCAGVNPCLSASDPNYHWRQWEKIYMWGENATYMRDNPDVERLRALKSNRLRPARPQGWGLGGLSTIFFRIATSSHIHVQMGRELVRLVDLIHLNMFSTHIGHWKSSENFLSTRLGRSVLKNPVKMAFFGFL